MQIGKSIRVLLVEPLRPVIPAEAWLPRQAVEATGSGAGERAPAPRT